MLVLFWKVARERLPTLTLNIICDSLCLYSALPFASWQNVTTFGFRNGYSCTKTHATVTPLKDFDFRSYHIVLVSEYRCLSVRQGTCCAAANLPVGYEAS